MMGLARLVLIKISHNWKCIFACILISYTIEQNLVFLSRSLKKFLYSFKDHLIDLNKFKDLVDILLDIEKEFVLKMQMKFIFHLFKF